MQQIITYWRDLPSQVIVKKGRERGKALLSPRFQQAIDRAAMRAGRGGSAEYLADWRRVASQVDGAAPQALADSLAAALESDYPAPRLARLVKNNGREPDNV